MALEAFPTVRLAELRKRSVGNLLRMGHCAPSVMQTVVDASASEAKWLVKLTAGLPGGIGNTRGECGELTAPLVLIGLTHRRDEVAGGLPVAVEKGHDPLRGFEALHGTTECRAILGDARLPLRCVGVVRQSPSMCAQRLAARNGAALAPATRDACRELYAHWRMLGTMAVGRNALADELNAFNPVMNLGHELAKWFEGEFGSTQCRALTGCDFASTEEVREYIATDGTARCTRIARQVAARVADLVELSPAAGNGPATASTTVGMHRGG